MGQCLAGDPQLGFTHKAGVHEFSTGVHPAPQMLDLALPRSVQLPRMVGAGRAWSLPPLLEIADLRFGHLRGQLIDHRVQARAAPDRLSQFGIAVDIGLPEAGVLEQLSEPGIAVGIGREEIRATRVVPSLRIVITTIGRFHAAVTVPRWAVFDLGAAILEEIGAQTKSIDVVRQHVDQMVVDPRIDVDILRVALWIVQVRLASASPRRRSVGPCTHCLLLVRRLLIVGNASAWALGIDPVERPTARRR